MENVNKIKIKKAISHTYDLFVNQSSFFIVLVSYIKFHVVFCYTGAYDICTLTHSNILLSMQKIVQHILLLISLVVNFV